MTKETKERQYSKTMETINYWLREQGFPRYDSLYWDTKGRKTFLYFNDTLVAEVYWHLVSQDHKEFYTPFFEFFGMYKSFNENQIRFWIGRNLQAELEKESK